MLDITKNIIANFKYDISYHSTLHEWQPLVYLIYKRKKICKCYLLKGFLLIKLLIASQSASFPVYPVNEKCYL